MRGSRNPPAPTKKALAYLVRWSFLFCLCVRLTNAGGFEQQQRRPLPAAEIGRSCWGCGQQDARAAQGTMQPLEAATRAPYTARLAQSTRAHQKASTYTSTRYPCSPCFRFSVCIRNFNCWTFFLHFDMLFLLYPFHLCTVNVKAKDQSCKAFWLNNSGLFCWSLCNSPFCLSMILQRCTLSRGGGC